MIGLDEPGSGVLAAWVLGAALLVVLPRVLGGIGTARGWWGRLAGEDPWPVRVAWLLALAVVAWVARDRTSPGAVRTTPPRRTVVTTGPAVGDAWLDRLRGEVERSGGRLTVHEGAARGLPTALAAAALTARAADEIALVWTGPMQADRVRGADPVGGGVYTAAAPLGFEPSRLRLWLTGPPPRVGRPTRLELVALGAGFGGLPEDLQIRVEVAGTGHVYTPAERLAGARGFQLPWVPDTPGSAALQVALQRADGDPVVATARGSVEVAAADAEPVPVLVFGQGAVGVVAALAAQGVVGTVCEGPEDLAEALRDAPPASRVVVALSELPEATQQLLAERVDSGDGLALFGAALPAAGTPLVDTSPFGPRPRPEGLEGVGSGGDGAADTEQDRTPDADPPPPEGEPPIGPPPPEPGEAPPPGDDGGRPLAGDTSAADTGAVEEVEVERRRVALVLVLDRSGSMAESTGPVAGPTKVQLVKTSAFRIAQGLEPNDELGVLAFHQRPEVVVPLGPLPPPDVLRARLERIRADGNTKVGHALRAAEEMLAGSAQPVRHVVLLTDGEDLDATDVRVAQAAARRLGQAGATVSVIHVATSRLTGEVAEIAAFGGGKYLKTEDGSAIPRLMFAEVRRVLGAAGRRPADDVTGTDSGTGGEVAGTASADPEPGEPEPVDPPTAPDRPDDPLGPEADPAVAETTPPEADALPPPVPVFPVEVSPLVEPWVEQGFPPLRGAPPPGLRARPSAQTLLATAVGEPVLGVASRGLGRVLGFAVPWGGVETGAWVDDPRSPAWLATWVAAVRPSAGVGFDEIERELLGAYELSEPAPRPDEVAALERLGGALRPVAALGPGGEGRVREAPRPRGGDDARWALAALLAVAVVERLARGLGTGPRGGRA